MLKTIGLALAAVLLPMAAGAQQPYAGQQARDIKALSAEEIADLLAGRGMGLAKAAELNHFPGPAHVIEMREALGLTDTQLARLRAIFARMSAAAIPLGTELIEHERTLDRAFAAATITPELLASEMTAIGTLQGRLRGIHLAAHLDLRPILTPEQIARYDQLRGYGAGAPTVHEPQRHGG